MVKSKCKTFTLNALHGTNGTMSLMKPFVNKAVIAETISGGAVTSGAIVNGAVIGGANISSSKSIGEI